MGKILHLLSLLSLRKSILLQSHHLTTYYRQARTQDFRMGGARPSGCAPHADGPPAEKGATDDEGDFC